MQCEPSRMIGVVPGPIAKSRSPKTVPFRRVNTSPADIVPHGKVSYPTPEKSMTSRDSPMIADKIATLIKSDDFYRDWIVVRSGVSIRYHVCWVCHHSYVCDSYDSKTSRRVDINHGSVEQGPFKMGGDHVIFPPLKERGYVSVIVDEDDSVDWKASISNIQIRFTKACPCIQLPREETISICKYLHIDYTKLMEPPPVVRLMSCNEDLEHPFVYLPFICSSKCLKSAKCLSFKAEEEESKQSELNRENKKKRMHRKNKHKNKKIQPFYDPTLIAILRRSGESLKGFTTRARGIDLDFCDCGACSADPFRPSPPKRKPSQEGGCPCF